MCFCLMHFFKIRTCLCQKVLEIHPSLLKEMVIHGDNDREFMFFAHIWKRKLICEFEGKLMKLIIFMGCLLIELGAKTNGYIPQNAMVV